MIPRPFLRSATRLPSRLSTTLPILLFQRTLTTTPLRSSSSQYPSNQTQYSHPSTTSATQSNANPSTQPQKPTNFYRTHTRALFKSLTLAFLSYQIFYWAWLTLESESVRDEMGGEIRALEGEVRMLGSGRGSHLVGRGDTEEEGDGKRLLEVEGDGNGKSGK